MVLDDFLNDKIQEFPGELRVQIGLARKILEPRNLLFFARGVGWGKIVMRLQDAHGLCVFEPLGQRKDEDRIKAINRLAVFLEQACSLGNGISQWPSLSV